MLKDLVKAREKGGLVVPLLQEAALLAGKKDSYRRKRDCFHPSEICGDFCPRSWVLGQRDPSLYLKQEVGPELQWKFDTGSMSHELVQERLGNAGYLFGEWRCKRWCLSERCRFFGFKPKRNACPLGAKHKAKFEYGEVRVVDEELCIAGKTDGILVIPRGKYVFEYKTMRSATFDTLAEPLDEHKEQAVLYLEVLKKNNDLLVDMLVEMQETGMCVDAELAVAQMSYKGVVLVYQNKDTQKFKEFVIDVRTPLKIPSSIELGEIVVETEEDWIEQKFDLLRRTLEYRKDGVLPDRLEACGSKTSARARSCFAKDACFGEE